MLGEQKLEPWGSEEIARIRYRALRGSMAGGVDVTEMAPPDDEIETLRRQVAAVRMEAIRPLLTRRRKCGSVQACATQLGIEPDVNAP